MLPALDSWEQVLTLSSVANSSVQRTSFCIHWLQYVDSKQVLSEPYQVSVKPAQIHRSKHKCDPDLTLQLLSWTLFDGSNTAVLFAGAKQASAIGLTELGHTCA